MNIALLKSYELSKDKISKNKKLLPEGMSIAEIEGLETALNGGTPFPKAFREYLYIGGKFNSIGFEDGLGDFIALNKYYKKKGKSKRFKNRPSLFSNR